MLRRILAVTAGIVLGVLVLLAVESLGQLVFPPPPGLDPHDTEAMKAYIARMPAAALLWVALGWSLGCFAGGWLAARLTDNRPRQCALSVAGFLMAAGIAHLWLMPHPAWFWLVGLIGMLPAGWAGFRLSGKTALDG